MAAAVLRANVESQYEDAMNDLARDLLPQGKPLVVTMFNAPALGEALKELSQFAH